MDGPPLACNTPPLNECLDVQHQLAFSPIGSCLQASGCQYESSVKKCNDGCWDRTCLEVLVLSQAELVSRSALGLTSGPYKMSFVMSGWYKSETMRSSTHQLKAGFKP